MREDSTSRTCNHVAEQSPYCTLATRTCTDALPCATSGDLMRVRRQFTDRWAQSVVPSTSQIEPSGKCTATARNRTQEISLVPAPACAGSLRCRSRHLLSFDLENRWEPAHASRCCRGSRWAGDGAHCGKWRRRGGGYSLRVAVVRGRRWSVVSLWVGGTPLTVASGGGVGRVGGVRVWGSQWWESG
jgi:hypothetical protein